MPATVHHADRDARHDALRTELTAALGDEVVTVDPDRMSSYRYDRASDPAAGTPVALVRARSTAEVQAAVRLAAAHRVPIVTRGAGTGLSGGSTARDDAITISTELMRDIDIDPRTRMARVGPGLLNAEVKAAVATHGLWYPPDPSSFEICSIGGNIATNAGGLCCVKYGVTSDYVLGLEVVLADGRAVKLGGPRLKDVAGLSLTKLFVGSEGVLGIITEVTLRLLPAQQRASVAVGFFASMDDAVAAVLQITSRIRPSMLELMDSVSVNAVEDMTRMGLDREAGAMLIAGTDAGSEEGARELAVIEAAFTEHGSGECFVTDDAEEAEQFIVARRAAIPAVERMGSLLLEDVGVPIPSLGELVEGIRQIAQAHGIVISVIAHAGDGNTHPLLVFDPADPEQAAHAEQAFGEVMDLAISLGGTITGEHGAGTLKSPWLSACLGEDVLELNRRVKDALDPDGLLNPGVMFG